MISMVFHIKFKLDHPVGKPATSLCNTKACGWLVSMCGFENFAVWIWWPIRLWQFFGLVLSSSVRSLCSPWGFAALNFCGFAAYGNPVWLDIKITKTMVHTSCTLENLRKSGLRLFIILNALFYSCFHLSICLLVNYQIPFINSPICTFVNMSFDNKLIYQSVCLSMFPSVNLSVCSLSMSIF